MNILHSFQGDFKILVKSDIHVFQKNFLAHPSHIGLKNQSLMVLLSGALFQTAISSLIHANFQLYFHHTSSCH